MFRAVSLYDEFAADKWKYDKVVTCLQYQRNKMNKQKVAIEVLLKSVKKNDGAIGLDDLATQLDLVKDRFHNFGILHERAQTLKGQGDEELKTIDVDALYAKDIKEHNSYVADIERFIAEYKDRNLKKNVKTEAEASAEVKYIRHLQPQKLTEKATLSEKRVWRLQFDAFYNSSNFRVADIKEQQQYLLLNLSTTLAANLLRRIKDDWPVYSDQGDSCMKALDSIFSQIHPVYARRNAMLSMRRHSDESYGDWSTRLKNAAEEAGIDTLTHDEFITMMLVSFSNDTYLDTEFQRLENPTVAQCDAIGSSWDRGENFKADTQQKEVKVYQVSNSSNPRAQQQKQRTSKGSFSKFLAGKCARCSGSGHNSSDCQAKNLNCSYCQKPNHVQAVCYTRFQHSLNGKAKARQAAPGEQPQQQQVPPAPQQQQQQLQPFDNVLQQLSQSGDVQLSPEQAAAVARAARAAQTPGGKPAHQATPPLFL